VPSAPRSIGVVTPTLESEAPGSAQPAAATPATSVGAGASPPTAGEVWQALTDFPAESAFEVTSVTPAGTGFVAVGFGPLPGEGYFGRHQGIVWRSDDGRSWTVAADPAFQFVTPEEVLAVGDTIYVFGTIATCDALFSDECVEPPEAGWAVWRSTSGAAWERLPQLPQMQFGSVDGVALMGMTLVAFGTTGDEAQAIVWTSGDGATWTATTELAGMDQVTAADGGPTGLAIFGNRFSDELEDLELVAATAADGVNFTKAVTPGMTGTTMRSIANGSAGWVAVGETESEELELDAVALHSGDSANWTQSTAPDGSFVNAGASFVHGVPTGYVSVGIVPVDDAFGSSTGMAWSSVDGQQWRSLAPFGTEFTTLDTSAAGAPGVVLFTATSDEPDEVTVTSTIGAWLAPAEVLPGTP